MGMLGRVLVLDMLTNNWDRLPFGQLWNHGGNLANVLFDRRSGEPYAIDNSVTCLNPSKAGAAHRHYLQRVHTVTAEVLSAHLDTPACASKPFVDLAALLVHRSNPGADPESPPSMPSDKDAKEKHTQRLHTIALAMQRGFVFSLERAAGLTSEQLQSTLDRVRAQFDEMIRVLAFTDESVGLDRVHVPFLVDVVRFAFAPLWAWAHTPAHSRAKQPPPFDPKGELGKSEPNTPASAAAPASPPVAAAGTGHGDAKKS